MNLRRFSQSNPARRAGGIVAGGETTGPTTPFALRPGAGAGNLRGASATPSGVDPLECGSPLPLSGARSRKRQGTGALQNPARRAAEILAGGATLGLTIPLALRPGAGAGNLRGASATPSGVVRAGGREPRVSPGANLWRPRRGSGRDPKPTEAAQSSAGRERGVPLAFWSVQNRERVVRLAIFSLQNPKPDVRLAFFSLQNPKPDVRLAIFDVPVRAPDVRLAIFSLPNPKPDVRLAIFSLPNRGRNVSVRVWSMPKRDRTVPVWISSSPKRGRNLHS